MAATNRPDMLDPAMLRPGRCVSPPGYLPSLQICLNKDANPMPNIIEII